MLKERLVEATADACEAGGRAGDQAARGAAIALADAREEVTQLKQIVQAARASEDGLRLAIATQSRQAAVERDTWESAVEALRQEAYEAEARHATELHRLREERAHHSTAQEARLGELAAQLKEAVVRRHTEELGGVGGAAHSVVALKAELEAARAQHARELQDSQASHARALKTMQAMLDDRAAQFRQAADSHLARLERAQVCAIVFDRCIVKTGLFSCSYHPTELYFPTMAGGARSGY